MSRHNLTIRASLATRNALFCCPICAEFPRIFPAVAKKAGSNEAVFIVLKY